MSRPTTPRSIVLLVIAISVLPAILNLYGFSFGSSTAHRELQELTKLSEQELLYQMHAGLAGAYILVLLHWSSFIVTLFTAVFSSVS